MTKIIAVTGSAGNICYSLVFRLGEIYGPDQMIHLKLIDIKKDPLEGVRMELEDCFFPWLEKISCYDNPEEGFVDADIVLLVGAKPRGKGMERKDLLLDNGKIFKSQAAAFKKSKSSVKVLVVGNPCNTNALITLKYSSLKRENLMAMTMLDQLRAQSMLKLEGYKEDVTICGNHSGTMVVAPADASIEEDWMINQLNPLVQKRGAAIIRARGASSAASAANAAIFHMRCWVKGDLSFSASVYDEDMKIFFSTKIKANKIPSNPVELEMKRYAKQPKILAMIKKTKDELLNEREAIERL